MITYQQLKTFLAVVRAGSPTRAARELHTTQPTVSLSLQALRKFFGAPLIERTSAGFRLTPVGERLRRYAEEALGGLRLVQQDAATFTGRVAGPLTVGATFSVGGYVLPTSLSRFREQFPEVKLEVHVDARPQHLFASLFAQTLDLACFVRVQTPQGLTVEAIGDEELVVAAAPEHPLATKRRVRGSELSAHPFIAAGLPDYRAMAEGKLRQVGVVPNVAGEGPHQDAVKRLVARNAGYALLIKSVIARDLASGRLVGLNLDGAPFPTDVVVAYRDGALSPVGRHFIDFMRQALAEGARSTTDRTRGRRPAQGRPVSRRQKRSPRR
jgi:DNA-binding transcriptional LysR family regulator